MSMNVISIDASELDRIVQALAEFPKEIKPAMSRAVNRSMSAARTQMAKEVRAEYDVKYGEVLKATKIKKSTPKTLTAIANISGGQTAMYKFKHKPSKKPPKQRYKQPVKVVIKKSAGEKIAGKNGNKAFIQTLNSKDMLLVRKGKSRYPIEKLYSLSAAQMVSDKAATKDTIIRVQARAQTILINTVDQEIKYRLAKVAKQKQGGNK